MTYHYQPAAVLRDQAKQKMAGHYGSAISMTLLYFCSSLMADSCSLSISNGLDKLFVKMNFVSPAAVVVENVIAYLLAALLTIIVNMLLGGMALYYMNLACGGNAKAIQIFSGFTERPKRTLMVSALFSAPQLIALIPYNVFSTLYYEAYMLGGNTKQYLPGMIISFLIGAALTGYVMLNVGLSFYLMQDFPDLSAKDIIRKGWKLMKGQKVRLFCLAASFLPLLLLCLLTFGLGLLWIYPVMQESFVCFYLDLMNPKEVTSEWHTAGTSE